MFSPLLTISSHVCYPTRLSHFAFWITSLRLLFAYVCISRTSPLFVLASHILSCNSLQLAALRTDIDRLGSRKHGDEIMSRLNSREFATATPRTLPTKPAWGPDSLLQFLVSLSIQCLWESWRTPGLVHANYRQYPTRRSYSSREDPALNVSEIPRRMRSFTARQFAIAFSFPLCSRRVLDHISFQKRTTGMRRLR
jgi:hypothetical protein